MTEEYMEWNQNEVFIPEDAVTVADMEALCRQISQARQVAENAAQKAKEENKKVQTLELKLQGFLEALGKDSYKSEVGLFGLNERVSLRVPQGSEKETFFSHLKEIGQLEEIATVNYQTLNGWFQRQFEAAKEKGLVQDIAEFSVPGLGQIKTNKYISFKRK